MMDRTGDRQLKGAGVSGAPGAGVKAQPTTWVPVTLLTAQPFQPKGIFIEKTDRDHSRTLRADPVGRWGSHESFMTRTNPPC